MLSLLAWRDGFPSFPPPPSGRRRKGEGRRGKA
jgi:hypothetical protein